MSVRGVFPLEVKRLSVVMELFLDEVSGVLMRKTMALFIFPDSLAHASKLGSISADRVTLPFL